MKFASSDLFLDKLNHVDRNLCMVSLLIRRQYLEVELKKCVLYNNCLRI